MPEFKHLTSMYAKIFQQIYSSSIAEDYKQRLVFMDLLVLSDQNGVVDMTHEGIARFTNVPVQIIREAITALEAPDPRSRNKAEGGARIVRIDEHRDWGWWIVNYERYREIASEEQRREKTRERVAKFKARQRLANEVTQGNALVTPSNASNAKQKDNKKEKENNKDGEYKPNNSPKQPESEFVKAWNDLGLLQIRVMSAGRRKHFAARCTDEFWRDNWRAAIAKVREMDWVKGNNNRGWKADVDWFLRPDTVLKIMEGKYDDHERRQPQEQQTEYPFWNCAP